MADTTAAPITNAPSRTTRVASTLPPEVITCLQNARFLHLATSSPSACPHISLMNYTYLPPSTSPFPSTQSLPVIIMTTPPSSQKTHNLESNPRVSLLVHDWVSHRPPTLQSTRSTSPQRAGSSSLASLLLGMNTASLGRISTTINGSAELIPQGSEEEAWYKARHLENNTFGDDPLSTSPQPGGGLWGGRENTDLAEQDDGGRGRYIVGEGEEVRVVVVKIRDGRIADWKGGVRDWVVQVEREGAAGGMVNGVQ